MAAIGKLLHTYIHTYIPVSYTHLDVYKRQMENRAGR